MGNIGHILSPWSVLPFVGILLSIAFLPLWKPHFWESHLNKAWVSLFWVVPILVYFFSLSASVELLHSIKEYLSFIILIGSLFIISGGILIKGDLRSTPFINMMFLLIGSILANFIGTTGASMLLIRPLLNTNRERKFTKHIPVFFIFLVSNIGGCLTPLGDPPLFMGYLRGVPFFWTLRLIPEWFCATAIVLLMFYLLDRHNYGKENIADKSLDKKNIEPLTLEGKTNFIWLLGVILGIFIATPYREIVLALMAVLSMVTTKKEYREGNKFTFGPIIEVAVLFAGIFITMVPALLILNARGAEFGINKPWQFFWLSGSLSSFLDNTPTYMSFFSLAQGLGLNGAISGIPDQFLRAISCGAVFMGANSYIGNGPNFMVKAIAEENKIKMPSFMGYMAYSFAILIPMYIIQTFLFFR